MNLPPAAPGPPSASPRRRCSARWRLCSRSWRCRSSRPRRGSSTTRLPSWRLSPRSSTGRARARWSWCCRGCSRPSSASTLGPSHGHPRRRGARRSRHAHRAARGRHARARPGHGRGSVIAVAACVVGNIFVTPLYNRHHGRGGHPEHRPDPAALQPAQGRHHERGHGPHPQAGLRARQPLGRREERGLAA